MFSKTSMAKADKLRAKAEASRQAIVGMHHAITILQRDAENNVAEAQRIDPHCQTRFGSFGGDTPCVKPRLRPDQVKRGWCDVCETNRLRREAAEQKRAAEREAQLVKDTEQYGVYDCCGRPAKRTTYNGRPVDGEHAGDCSTCPSPPVFKEAAGQPL